MGIYEDLSIRGVINGVGAQTRLSGTLIREGAMQAMVEASRALVSIEELQARASRVISRVTGAEAGLVTSGAAAALCLATAAAVAGLDIDKMDRLPDTSGMKNEVVMARHHRNAYDHMIRLAGVKIVEAGLDESGLGVGVRGVEAREIAAAINEKTAAVAYVQRPGSGPPLRDVARVAQAHGIPVIVDAAAELPPASNLKSLVGQGASLVVFSGGKAVRGPQSTGILCGKKKLVMSAALQMIDMDARFETWEPPADFIDKSKLAGIPRHGIGRGFKVGKEEIAGLVRALELYAAEDETLTMAAYERIARRLVEALAGNRAVEAVFIPPSVRHTLPQVRLRFRQVPDLEGMVGVVGKLREGDPAVYLDESRLEEAVLTVNPLNLSEGDVDLIASRVVGLS